MAVIAIRYQRRWDAAPTTVFPEEHGGLSKSAVRLWNALARRGALANCLDFSPSRLAPEIEMCRSTIFAALRELAMKGFIFRQRIGRLVRVHCLTPQRGRA